jgi:dTDP-glucose 4,6-dehydratase
MTEKAIVIGSNSFSGASFIRHSLKQGLQVIGMSRSKESNDAFLPYKWIRKGDFQFHQLDLNHDLNKIMETIKSEKPDYIINFAAQSMVAQSWDNPDHWYTTNLVSTSKLHDRLRNCNFLKKYVHISTPEVYGSCDGYIKENTIYAPSTPYAVSRAAADMSLLAYWKAYKFPVVFTRAANVYGPGQQLYRIIPRTIMFIKLGKKLQLHGGGVSTRSFIHMDDVSQATLRIARDSPTGEIFHISTNETYSIRDLVELICDTMNVRFENVAEVGEDRLGKDAAYLLDSTKLRDTLNWKDFIPLKKGIKEVIDWVENNFEVLKSQPHEYIHKP